jgi:hypothetical protein
MSLARRLTAVFVHLVAVSTVLGRGDFELCKDGKHFVITGWIGYKGCQLFGGGEDHCHCKPGGELTVEGSLLPVVRNSGNVIDVRNPTLLLTSLSVVECFGGTWMKKERAWAGYAEYECVPSPTPQRCISHDSLRKK